MGELSVAEQRYQAVLAVISDGWSVSQIGRRNLGLTSDSSEFVRHRIECAQRV